MTLPPSMPHKNGQPPASPESGEAAAFNPKLEDPAFAEPVADPSVASQTFRDAGWSQNAASPNLNPPNAAGKITSKSPLTVFPTDLPNPSLRTTFYHLTHFYLAGATLFRWLIILLSALFVLILWLGPSYWIATLAIWFSLTLALFIWRRRLQKEDFVRFEAETPPDRGTTAEALSATAPERLESADKIPVHVTGLFTVENREERFTWVPGFYRTFATREHALLCQVQETTFLRVAKPDEETVGMWYIFFQPDEVTEIRWGKLIFGAKPSPAIAITRGIERKAKRRFSRDKVSYETTYLAFKDELERRRVWSDLQADHSA